MLRTCYFTDFYYLFTNIKNCDFVILQTFTIVITNLQFIKCSTNCNLQTFQEIQKLRFCDFTNIYSCNYKLLL